MTLKRRFYITSFVAAIFAVLSFVFKDLQNEIPIIINMLLGGTILYILFFYLLETGKLKTNWTKPVYKNIFYGLTIIVLIVSITLASKIDENGDSFWVINYNIWLVDLLVFLLISFIFYIVFSWFFERWKAVRTLKNEKSKAELSLLKEQINPHFFNTLNNLYSLIKKDPDAAQNYVLKLSDLMRFTIYDSGKENVILGEEINYLTNFIDLQTSRYHKEIKISFVKNVENLNTKIAPLLFIILLENAFKHGVEKLTEDTFVQVELKENNEIIHFSVVNNFDKNESSKSRGIGLKNLKERLELVYPNKYNLSHKIENNIYSATLEILKK
ncbi:sensor histidine kinase [Polaribacter ponticola]|uniref:Histidine kinase n=1 Tax=Polaribacter ponticola TaxID=2978475 RepID=A0ABT5S6I0_9FLAO|nr:histidine kinase [Polaribacter sp. MSW5]MDD7913707.1 histidine kinase [Polaribacter sp. MSW5]